MSYINILEQIAEKYAMEQNDKEWIKVIVEDYIELANDYEKLENTFNKAWEGLNKIIKKYERRTKK